MTDPSDDMLEDLFAQARDRAPEVSDDLMSRVLADAEMAQNMLPVVQPEPGLGKRLLDLIGGWPTLGGLVAATIAGFWVGVAPPVAVEDLTVGLIGDTVSVSLFSESDFLEIGGLGDG